MGWSIDFKADKNILEEDIQAIVDNLPSELSQKWGNSRQYWGWSTAVDINNPEGNKFYISGAYGLSDHIAIEFRDYLRREMKKKGYKIRTRANL